MSRDIAASAKRGELAGGTVQPGTVWAPRKGTGNAASQSLSRHALLSPRLTASLGNTRTRQLLTGDRASTGRDVDGAAPVTDGVAHLAGDASSGSPRLEIEPSISEVGDLLSHEGLSLLTDPQGALDREDARLALAPYFQIIGPDFVGPRAQNQVTADEYEQIVRTYSDIRRGRGDLTIDAPELTATGQAEAYRAGVMSDIATMMQTRTGRQMIETLSNNPMVDDSGHERAFLLGQDLTGTVFEVLGSSEHHHTTIRPCHENANNNRRSDDDAAAPLDHRNAQSDDLWPADGTRSRGASQRQADGSRGSGSDPTVRYNPDLLGRFDGNDDGVPNQTTSDIILMHELAHAWHQSQGTLATGIVQATDSNLLPTRWGHPPTTLGANDPDVGEDRFEHQAAGLGRWGASPMTENQYRADKADLGQIQPDGNPIPLRPNYGVLP